MLSGARPDRDSARYPRLRGAIARGPAFVRVRLTPVSKRFSLGEAFLALALLAGLSPWAAHLSAQAVATELSGVVTDASGAVLPGVVVTLTHQASGRDRQATTDTGGAYFFAFVPPGEYSLRAELTNFKSVVRRSLTLSVARAARIDLSLEVGPISEEIVVTAEPPRSTTAEVGQVIERQRLLDLPLNGRNYTDLSQLGDNVVIEPRGTRGAALGQTGQTIAIAGQRGGHNMYFLDGVSVTDQYFNNLVLSPPVDAVREFNIQKSIYAAEFGGKASAVVSAATMSGGNSLHGTVYEFFRNDILDARNFFDDRNEPAPPLRQNQFGAALGGPIRKERTFFFASYEGLRERRGLTGTFSVPSQRVRTGDFSGGNLIHDPLSTEVSGQRRPFPNNRVPTDRLDRVAGTFLEVVPAPVIPGEVQNFIATPKLTNDHDQFLARGDHSISEHDTVFVRYSQADLKTFRPFGSTDLNELLLPGFGTGITTQTHNMAFGHTHVFSPSLVHDFRLGFLRVTGGQRSENQGVDFAGASGLRGVTQDPERSGYPAFRFSGAYSDMGDPSTVVSRRNTSFDFFSNLLWSRGSHTMKYGAYVYYLRFNPSNAPDARGSFGFTPRFTSAAAGLGDGNAFADFLLGYPSTARGGFGRGRENGRTLWTHLYAQDEWRVGRNLTLSSGLRYEINQQMRDADNRLSNIQDGRFIIASDADGRIHPDAEELLPLIPVPVVTSAEAGLDRSLLRPGQWRLAPRLGLAWSPGGSRKTVVRAGFGLFFNQWAYSVQTNLMLNLPFYFNKNVNTAVDLRVPALTTTNILESPNTGSIGGSAMDQAFRTEYAESWVFSLERAISSNWVAHLTYLGSKVVGADNTTLQNIPEPGPGPIDLRRPVPGLSGIPTIHWGGYSSYQAMTARLERRYAAGATFDLSYSWSKSIDDASSPGPTFYESNFPQNVRNVASGEKALSSFDHRHRLVVSAIYELPGFEGHRWKWLSKLASGWKTTAIGTLQSAAPFTVNLPTDNANIGAGPAQRPDVLRDPNQIARRTPQAWFDTAAFTMPAQFTFGNSGRNLARADALTNLDFSVLKDTSIREDVNLQFRAEFFNLLNQTNLADAPGRIAFTPNFGRFFRAENPRQIQLGLKLVF